MFKSIYILLLLNTTSLFAQNTFQSYSYSHINTTSGLSNNLVFDIVQDNDGYIWIATNNGLNKYDGYNFKVFYNSADSTSISSNVVRKLLIDSKGDLWIATNNGFNLYDKNKKGFQRYPLLNDDDFLMDVFNAVVDKNDNIWFSYGKGIGKFNIETKSLLKIPHKLNTTQLLYNKERSIWLSSIDGSLKSVDIKKNIIRDFLKDTSLVKSFIFRGDISNDIWLPNTFSNRLLSSGFRKLPRLPKDKRPYSLLEIDSVKVFMGNYLGLYDYRPKTNTLYEVSLMDSPSSLTKQIRCIYKDNYGGIWIGTANGVFYTDPYRKAFNHLNIKTEENDVVMAMHQGQYGTFINILGDGLYQFDNDDNNYKKIKFPNWIPNGASFIWEISEINESTYPIWMATGNGFYGYDPKSKKLKSLNLEYLNTNKRESFSMQNTKDDFVWVASQYQIHKVHKNNLDVISSFTLPIDFSDKHEGIQKILSFNDKLIISTVSHGLYQFTPKNNAFKKIKFKNNNLIDDFKLPIWDLYEANNTLWIGTNSGLYKWDKTQKVAEKVIKDNYVIFSITSNEGFLWLGTEKGLLKYSIKDNTYLNFNTEDGLKNTEFNRKSIIKDSLGNFWFGGVNGVTIFNPNTIKSNTIKPKVEITKMDIIKTDTLKSVDLYKDHKITLPYNDNNFVIDFVALNYTNPIENKYKYQLIGHNTNWIEENNRRARFFQISPGNYTFKVIASNNDNVWNEIGETLEIEIRSPYWQTWWFYSLLVLIFFLILYSIYVYRVRKIVELERTKLRIAGDLHDEIGSGLSSIALTSDILSSSEIQEKDKKKLIKRISNNSRTLASKLDDIVWLINPNKETLNDYIIKTTMVAKELLIKEKVTIKNDISFTDERIVLSSDYKRHLLLFTKEVINNITKHAKASQVLISFTYQSNILKIIIKDDGRGFDLNLKTAGNGILSLKNRAKEIKGELKIISKISDGTTLTLNVKLP